ncbi:MAG: hypothetical protein LBE86_03440 [Gemmobacter sp.]|jgi:hypothetical protein|nr:hypothetical protein [Gemmobacter sp.]
MRDFFINWSEKLVTAFVALMVIAVAIAGFFTMFSPAGGFLQGLAVLIGGGLYAVIMGGMLYLFFGIFRNTQRTNQLLEELLRK